MTKDKKGITLVSLVVTVIVMVIIFSITLISATTILENAKLTNIQVGLYMAKTRAETLLEQYMFDKDKLSLVYFQSKKPANNNQDIKEIYTVGYYAYNDGSTHNKTNEFNAIVTLVNKNQNENKKLKYKYMLSEYDEIERKNNSKNSKFINAVKKIYSKEYHASYETPIYDETTGEYKKDATGNPIMEKVPRYLFVQWGPEECVSQGVYKKTTSGEIDKDAIVNEDDYIIVCYDLKSNYISVAYSKGYRRDNKIYYTLESLKNIDNTTEN